MLTTATVYKGSSKNVYLVPEHACAYFEFTDRYSIFDWGEMPDLLQHKGEALAQVGALFFQLLEGKGVRHHFQGLVNENGEALSAGERSRFMKVKAVDVIRPARTGSAYDYSAYQKAPSHCLVPLEVIFRWGAPKGSSVLKRHPEIKEGERFAKPIVEFTTKLEKGDRHLSAAEAQALAGMSDAEMNRLVTLTIDAATHLRDVVELVQGELWDGKFEWAFDGSFGAGRDFMMVDAIGLDEIRVSYQGKNLSKEFLRAHYRGSEWERALSAAKLEGGDFIKTCREKYQQEPALLPPAVKLAAEMMYPSFANDLHRLVRGGTIFDPSLNLAHWGREFL